MLLLPPRLRTCEYRIVADAEGQTVVDYRAPALTIAAFLVVGRFLHRRGTPSQKKNVFSVISVVNFIKPGKVITHYGLLASVQASVG